MKQTYLRFYQGVEVRSITRIDDEMVAAFTDIERGICLAAANHVAIDYIALLRDRMVISLKNNALPMIIDISDDLAMERQLYFGSEEEAPVFT